MLLCDNGSENTSEDPALWCHVDPICKERCRLLSPCFQRLGSIVCRPTHKGTEMEDQEWPFDAWLYLPSQANGLSIKHGTFTTQ